MPIFRVDRKRNVNRKLGCFSQNGELVKVFNNTNEAAEAIIKDNPSVGFKLARGRIYNTVKRWNKKATYAGYRWLYLDEENVPFEIKNGTLQVRGEV